MPREQLTIQSTGGNGVKLLYNVQWWIVTALAVLSGAMLALFTAGICFDVVVRTAGFKPLPYTATLVEYGLFYVTFLSAPWLLRDKGHVYVDMVNRVLPPRAKRINEIAVYILGIATCLTLAYAALYMTVDSYTRGDLDTRDFDMPRWLLFLPMALSFFLLALEFLSYLGGRDSMYSESRSDQL